MSDLTRNLADILYGPEFSHRDLPPKTPAPVLPVQTPAFHARDVHGDDLQAEGDDRRDLFEVMSRLAGLPIDDGFRPDPKDLA